ncbi:MAG TPA: glycosyltransferase family 4 protein, partial [Acidobacteriota bacterium]
IDINPELAIDCLTGRLQLRRLKDFCAIAVADSEYNRAELQEMGYANTAVLPIRVHFDKFDKKEDAFTRHTYDDDRTNIVVVGRTIPNKKLEDCLKIFACYQKYLNPRSRLIFAGFWRPFAPYYFALRAMTQELQLREVVFTGHVRFEELLAYYRMADVLLSMSEHEGFCVPLLEAFHMNVPVITFGACAVPFTAGKGGILIQEKNYLAIAEMMDRLCSQTGLRRGVLEAQQEQLRKHQGFPFEETLMRLVEVLQQTEPVQT